MRRRKKFAFQDSYNNVDDCIKLWILRLLVDLKCYTKMFDTQYSHYESEDLFTLFEIDVNDEEFDRLQGISKLKKLLQDAEKNVDEIKLPKLLANNLDQLKKLIGLNDNEIKLLSFVIFLNNDRLLNTAADFLGRELNSLKIFHILSVILRIEEAEIRKLLSPKSMLAKTALLILETKGYHDDLKGKLRILSSSFADRLISDDCSSPIDWLKNMVSLSHPPLLSLQKYDHLKIDIDVLLPYLKKGILENKKGINIFFYGVPGTGKTELTRIIAKHLNCPLYEISSEDEDGDPIGGGHRLSAVRASQAFFKQSNSLLLFDEVEDVFGDGDGIFGHKSTAQTRKAWMNRLLEENDIPTFWLCNKIDSVDPAFIRRFDWVIEVPIPPKKQRDIIIRENCGNILNDKEINILSSCQELAPAVITRAAKVVNSLTDEFSTQQLAKTFNSLINKTLIAQGHKGVDKNDTNGLPDIYDLDFINCDADLMKIAEGIKEYGNARICLFGIPGTGKSAYAKWLADYIQQPLVIKRGSDLLSMWVGRTEKNIERIFREAEDENAVLLIDEVDSFLQDRRSSHNSWEITGVNEMLTRMENYNGIFIASTNRIDGLDAASLRRFDLKIKFEALTAHQSWKLLHSYAEIFKLSIPNEAIHIELNRIENLTPGDFALVARRHRFKPILSIEELVSALKAEVNLKAPYQNKPIGFVC
jgi:SpoVK/Ycf46/Vps4 family AAA+-type ATPase